MICQKTSIVILSNTQMIPSFIIITVKEDNDILQFQHNLDHVTQWSNEWQLSFSFSKCKHVQVGNSPSMAYN